MARQRVAPENRQRSIRACRPCQASKKRCDSALPCASCIKRNCQEACIYDGPESVPGVAKKRRSGSIYSPPSIPTSRGRTVAKQNHIRPNPARSSRAGSENVRELDNLSHTTTIDSESEVAGTTPPGRVMVNSKGEKFYFGNSAGVSFLQFVRQVVSEHYGSCKFTDNERRDLILEVSIPDDDEINMALPDFSQDEQAALIENFHIATAGILDMYTKEEVFHIVHSLGKQGGLKDSIALLIIAIGAQCVTSNNRTYPEERSYYFKRGQQLAFKGMLEDLNVDTLNVFLLMSFYLLAACRRNTAFLYVGIAARSAQALGLHAPEQYQHLSDTEQNTRIRAWKSLRVFDLMVASVLCRPAASQCNRFDSLLFRQINPLGDRAGQEITVSANFQLCAILESIVQHLDQKRGMSMAIAQQFLVQLRRWGLSLPINLRKVTIKSPLPFDEHRAAIGNISISCLYYFAVILITRPYLITHLLDTLKPSRRKEEEKLSEIQAQEVRKLARACVDAAILMARTCRDALVVNILLDNMCMLKAWIFTASLVLGFTRFADPNNHADIEAAFEAGLGTLKRLAQPSGCPQSAHYVELLDRLRSATNEYHEELRHRQLNENSIYVTQLLVIDGQGDGPSGLDRITTFATPGMGSGNLVQSDTENILSDQNWQIEQFLGGTVPWFDTSIIDDMGEEGTHDTTLLGDAFFGTEQMHAIFDDL